MTRSSAKAYSRNAEIDRTPITERRRNTAVETTAIRR
jgi:hypothetical protein